MKKQLALLLIALLLCGALSACAETAVTPTADPTEQAEATAAQDTPPVETPTLTPTTEAPVWTEPPAPTEPPEESLGSPAYEWLDYIYPSRFYPDRLPSYMTFVNAPFELYKMGYSVEPSQCIYDYLGMPKLQQYMPIPVNIFRKDGEFRYTLVLYDFVRNRISTWTNLDYGDKAVVADENTIWRYGGFHASSLEEYEEEKALREEAYADYNGEEMTTISKELGGKLSGGIYDVEYKRLFDYVVISNTGKYALVEQSLEYRPVIGYEDQDLYALQHNEDGSQAFALLDMESGKILKTYTFDEGFCYINTISFSSNDDHVILWYNLNDGDGSALPVTTAVVIDIEASLKSKD